MLTISIFIPVWFHPGSGKQGLSNCDSVSWDEIKELKDFISEQCLKAR
jgi:hypothetical protein